MKNILIINCGDAYPENGDKDNSVVGRIIQQSNLPDNVFRIYNIAQGEQPYHPAEYLAAIITGSEANVNQRLDWIRVLKDWVVTARYSNLPVLGICFGHQVIAEALGGKVEPMEQGSLAGALTVKVTKEGGKCNLFKKLAPSFDAFVSHSFVVTELPYGAELLATGPHEITEAFSMEKLYGIQFHPEYDQEMMKEVLGKMKLEPEAKIRTRLKNEYKSQSLIPNFLDLALKF